MIGTIKTRPAMFSNINTRNGRVDASVSLNYKNTMIKRITMETVACLRSKCHLKQNLIPSWPWSFRHTSCISDFRCKTKYTSKKICRTPGPAYLAVLPVLVIFCPLGPTNFKKSELTDPYSVWDQLDWKMFINGNFQNLKFLFFFQF